MEFITNLWSNYLVHIVDVLIVAYIFYKFMLFIKGTRAVQILIGIFILIIITFIAEDILHLRALSWLLNRFWLAAMVLLVVIFQPELRSFLAKLGSHKWSRLLMPSELDFVNEIVKFIKEYQCDHIGTLIVLEQNIGLRNYVETGTVINGRVSKELLSAIFMPKSALHDGAVIIQGSTIIAAGCVLPLSQNLQISKIFGTRHRAAIGISEVSDAIVIVVSEETGRISVAVNGKLESGIDAEDLRKRLMEAYSRFESSNMFFKKIFQDRR